MAIVGLSLVLASVVWVVFSRPPFLQRLFASFWSPRQIEQPPRDHDGAPRDTESGKEGGDGVRSPVIITTTESADDEKPTHASGTPGVVAPAPPTVEEPSSQTTPKAPAAQPSPNGSVPSFSLSSSPPASAAAIARSASAAMPPPAPPTFSAPKMPDPSFTTPSGSASSMMPPPPRPPTLNNLNPAATSRNNNLAAPNSFARSARQPGTSTLAPPPTHSSKPAKPSRKVMLEPGHSPLDWARLAQSPTSDLRNLPAGTPYLKVTPSQLKTMTGRRGKDAWTALGGRVYNITPYVAFHPGGGPELLRCAGRDGTRLFGEIHPWVNYEGMLASCMIGMLVEEGEERKSEMDDMD